MEIDHKLKQRLVGAAVITSLAAIFIPMLFDDPVDESRQSIRELTIPKAPVEVFDAHSVRIPKSVDQVIDTPEPDIVEDKYVLEKTPGTQPVKKPVIKSQTKPQKKPEKAGSMVRWVIQVGSFGTQKNAILLQDKLRKQGFNAFVELNDKKLYRVRVGPELDKKRAERTKARLEKINKMKTILVSE